MGFGAWQRITPSKTEKNHVSVMRKSKKNKQSSGGSKKMASRKKAKRGLSSPTSPAQQEAKWRAESDADALMRAKEILEDSERLKRARTVAEEKAKVAREAADSIKQL